MPNLNRSTKLRPLPCLILTCALTSLLAVAGYGHSNHNGDFDGDGVMDPTVYNESTGEWQTIMRSSNFEPTSFILGGPGHSAIQGDYDGDGRADAVAYNRATGLWTARLSSLNNATASIIFGGNDYQVVPGDFDGDGKDDPALYRESDGQWVALLTSAGYSQVSMVLGGPGYSAVTGDYDGDGRSDPGVYRRSDGLWRIAVSSWNYAEGTIHVDCYGDSPLVPAPFDYDGDGKTDPAVFAYGCGYSYGKQYVFCYYVLSSARNYAQNDPFRQLGREDCRDSNADPEPGDYDGDQIGDYGVSWPDNPDHIGWRMWRSRHGWSGHDDNEWNGDGFHPVQRY